LRSEVPQPSSAIVVVGRKLITQKKFPKIDYTRLYYPSAANKRLLRRNISLKNERGDPSDLRFKRREFLKALWQRDAAGCDETACNICSRSVGHFDFAAAHITADADCRLTAERLQLKMSDLPNVCICCPTCNADEGTVNLFEWLRFKGKTITTKQRKLEVNAIAWLEKHLDEPVPE
jgi:hypothetical protein